MKSIFTKATFLILFLTLSISCSKDESTSTTETGGSSVTISNTSAKFTVATPAGVVKPNYIVMMFDQPFSPSAVLLTSSILKQVTTDATGIANFDLNTLVTSTVAKKYYFEVFTQSGTTYTLKTTYSRFESDLAKGSKLTTTLLVNN